MISSERSTAATAVAKKRRWTWAECPGSGYPPYRYVPGATEHKLNKKTNRIQHARAYCEVCGRVKTVSVQGRLRKHLRRVEL